MARPHLEVLLTHESRTLITEISLAQDNFIVTYQGKPIKITRTSPEQHPRNINSVFATPAAAFNRRDQLNKLFNTNDFAVVIPHSYEPVEITERQITVRTYTLNKKLKGTE